MNPLTGALLNAGGAATNLINPELKIGEQEPDGLIAGTLFQIEQAIQKYLLRTLPNNIPTSRPSFNNVIIQQSGKVRIRPESLEPGANYAGHSTVYDNGVEVRTVASKRWGL